MMSRASKCRSQSEDVINANKEETNEALKQHSDGYLGR